MRIQFFPAIALAGMLSLAGCEPAAPTDALAPGAADAAKGSTTSEFVPIAFLLQDPCSPEVVEVSGRIHAVTQTSVARDGTVTWRIEQNWAGVKGVGQTSGLEYVVAGASHRVTTAAAPPPGEAMDALREVFVLVSKGRSDNFRSRIVSVARVDQDGNVTVEFESDDRCVG